MWWVRGAVTGGVDTSNDEELARALQAMLDDEYREELSIRLCEVCVSVCLLERVRLCEATLHLLAPLPWAC